MSKHMDKWAQIHRPEGHPASAGHMDTVGVSHGPQGTHSIMGQMDSIATGDRPRPQRAKGPFGTTALELREEGGGTGLEAPGHSPHADPSGSVCLPHLVEQLHHLIIDDEHDGHVQADPAQARHSALVECFEPLIP